jgi:hypothetical protein
MVLGGSGDKSLTFWKHDVKDYLRTMYYYVLDPEEADVEFDLRQSVDMRTVMIYALWNTGIVLSPRALVELMTGLDRFVVSFLFPTSFSSFLVTL